jgi:hypothetical protein
MAGDCSKCRELMDLASLATVRHMRALTRLELARLRAEEGLIPALEVAVAESCRARIKAEAAYQAHLSGHHAAQSGGAA